MKTEMDRLCEKKKVSIRSVLITDNPAMSGMPPGSLHYKVTLFRRVDRKRLRLTTTFSMGPAHCKEPTPADVLSCLISDSIFAEMTFGEFCSEIGYDEDSRKAERVWRACQAIGPKVRAFLGEEWSLWEGAEH